MKKGFKVLGLLLLSLFGLISFSSASSITITSINHDGYTPVSIAFGKTVSTLDFSFVNYSCTYPPCEIEIRNLNGAGRCVFSTLGGNTCDAYRGFSAEGFKFSTTANYFDSITITGIDLSSSCPECPTCPEIDTGAILSGYVAISDIDMNYCVSNDLCPEMSGGYSALYINDIRHESMPFINITIPEEFNWDYTYTGNNTQFDLNIIGYNTDPDYIAGIINTQSTKPNSTDFNNIVSGLIPLLIPGLVIILFVWFIFKFIKKIF